MISVSSFLPFLPIPVMLLKVLHDYVKPRNELIIERYINITGRIAALVVGTFAIEMIVQGLEGWGLFNR